MGVCGDGRGTGHSTGNRSSVTNEDSTTIRDGDKEFKAVVCRHVVEGTFEVVDGVDDLLWADGSKSQKTTDAIDDDNYVVVRMEKDEDVVETEMKADVGMFTVRGTRVLLDFEVRWEVFFFVRRGSRTSVGTWGKGCVGGVQWAKCGEAGVRRRGALAGNFDKGPCRQRQSQEEGVGKSSSFVRVTEATNDLKAFEASKGQSGDGRSFNLELD